jgi:hypothetical protein
MENESNKVTLAKGEDYLDLWKHFQQDASDVKQKMWTIASFLYTGLATVLGYLITHHGILTSNWKEPSTIAFISLVGLAGSEYGRYMLMSYGKHIQAGWDRADFIRGKYLKYLTEVWYLGKSEGLHSSQRKIPKETTTLTTILWAFTAILSMVSIVALGMLLK